MNKNHYNPLIITSLIGLGIFITVGAVYALSINRYKSHALDTVVLTASRNLCVCIRKSRFSTVGQVLMYSSVFTLLVCTLTRRKIKELYKPGPHVNIPEINSLIYVSFPNYKSWALCQKNLEFCRNLGIGNF